MRYTKILIFLINNFIKSKGAKMRKKIILILMLITFVLKDAQVMQIASQYNNHSANTNSKIATVSEFDWSKAELQKRFINFFTPKLLLGDIPEHLKDQNPTKIIEKLGENHEYAETNFGKQVAKFAKQKKCKIVYTKYNDIPMMSYANTIYIAPKFFDIIKRMSARDGFEKEVDEMVEAIFELLINDGDENDKYIQKIREIFGAESVNNKGYLSYLINWLDYEFLNKKGTVYSEESVFEIEKMLSANKKKKAQYNQGMRFNILDFARILMLIEVIANVVTPVSAQEQQGVVQSKSVTNSYSASATTNMMFSSLPESTQAFLRKQVQGLDVIPDDHVVVQIEEPLSPQVIHDQKGKIIEENIFFPFDDNSTFKDSKAYRMYKYDAFKKQKGEFEGFVSFSTTEKGGAIDIDTTWKNGILCVLNKEDQTYTQYISPDMDFSTEGKVIARKVWLENIRKMPAFFQNNKKYIVGNGKGVYIHKYISSENDNENDVIGYALMLDDFISPRKLVILQREFSISYPTEFKEFIGVENGLEHYVFYKTKSNIKSWYELRDAKKGEIVREIWVDDKGEIKKIKYPNATANLRDKDGWFTFEGSIHNKYFLNPDGYPVIFLDTFEKTIVWSGGGSHIAYSNNLLMVTHNYGKSNSKTTEVNMQIDLNDYKKMLTILSLLDENPNIKAQEIKDTLEKDLKPLSPEVQKDQKGLIRGNIIFFPVDEKSKFEESPAYRMYSYDASSKQKGEFFGWVRHIKKQKELENIPSTQLSTMIDPDIIWKNGIMHVRTDTGYSTYDSPEMSFSKKGKKIISQVETKNDKNIEYFFQNNKKYILTKDIYTNIYNDISAKIGDGLMGYACMDTAEIVDFRKPIILKREYLFSQHKQFREFIEEENGLYHYVVYGTNSVINSADDLNKAKKEKKIREIWINEKAVIIKARFHVTDNYEKHLERQEDGSYTDKLDSQMRYWLHENGVTKIVIDFGKEEIGWLQDNGFLKIDYSNREKLLRIRDINPYNKEKILTKASINIDLTDYPTLLFISDLLKKNPNITAQEIKDILENKNKWLEKKKIDASKPNEEARLDESSNYLMPTLIALASTLAGFTFIKRQSSKYKAVTILLSTSLGALLEKLASDKALEGALFGAMVGFFTLLGGEFYELLYEYRKPIEAPIKVKKIISLPFEIPADNEFLKQFKPADYDFEIDKKFNEKINALTNDIQKIAKKQILENPQNYKNFSSILETASSYKKEKITELEYTNFRFQLIKKYSEKGIEGLQEESGLISENFEALKKECANENPIIEVLEIIHRLSVEKSPQTKKYLKKRSIIQELAKKSGLSFEEIEIELGKKIADLIENNQPVILENELAEIKKLRQNIIATAENNKFIIFNRNFVDDIEKKLGKTTGRDLKAKYMKLSEEAGKIIFTCSRKDLEQAGYNMQEQVKILEIFDSQEQEAEKDKLVFVLGGRVYILKAVWDRMQEDNIYKNMVLEYAEKMQEVEKNVASASDGVSRTQMITAERMDMIDMDIKINFLADFDESEQAIISEEYKKIIEESLDEQDVQPINAEIRVIFKKLRDWKANNKEGVRELLDTDSENLKEIMNKLNLKNLKIYDFEEGMSEYKKGIYIYDGILFVSNVFFNKLNKFSNEQKLAVINFLQRQRDLMSKNSLEQIVNDLINTECVSVGISKPYLRKRIDEYKLDNLNIIEVRLQIVIELLKDLANEKVKQVIKRKQLDQEKIEKIQQELLAKKNAEGPAVKLDLVQPDSSDSEEEIVSNTAVRDLEEPKINLDQEKAETQQTINGNIKSLGLSIDYKLIGYLNFQKQVYYAHDLGYGFLSLKTDDGYDIYDVNNQKFLNFDANSHIEILWYKDGKAIFRYQKKHLWYVCDSEGKIIKREKNLPLFVLPESQVLPKQQKLEIKSGHVIKTKYASIPKVTQIEGIKDKLKKYSATLSGVTKNNYLNNAVLCNFDIFEFFADEHDENKQVLEALANYILTHFNSYEISKITSPEIMENLMVIYKSIKKSDLCLEVMRASLYREFDIKKLNYFLEQNEQTTENIRDIIDLWVTADDDRILDYFSTNRVGILKNLNDKIWLKPLVKKCKNLEEIGILLESCSVAVDLGLVNENGFDLDVNEIEKFIKTDLLQKMQINESLQLVSGLKKISVQELYEIYLIFLSSDDLKKAKLKNFIESKLRNKKYKKNIAKEFVLDSTFNINSGETNLQDEYKNRLKNFITDLICEVPDLVVSLNNINFDELSSQKVSILVEKIREHLHLAQIKLGFEKRASIRKKIEFFQNNKHLLDKESEIKELKNLKFRMTFDENISLQNMRDIDIVFDEKSRRISIFQEDASGYKKAVFTAVIRFDDKRLLVDKIECDLEYSGLKTEFINRLLAGLKNSGVNEIVFGARFNDVLPEGLAVSGGLASLIKLSDVKNWFDKITNMLKSKSQKVSQLLRELRSKLPIELYFMIDKFKFEEYEIKRLKGYVRSV
jgi:hypothetical protein